MRCAVPTAVVIYIKKTSEHVPSRCGSGSIV